MSTTTLEFTFTVDGSPTDASAVVLRDPTSAYGVKRTDTDAVVVAAGTAMTHAGTGQYSYAFTDPAREMEAAAKAGDAAQAEGVLQRLTRMAAQLEVPEVAIG